MASIKQTPENDILMEQFLLSRGSILTCFSQVEWFMAKILIEAHAFPEYNGVNLDFSIQAESRAKKLRMLFTAEGRLKKYADELLPLVDEIMEYSETRNFMAHGVVIAASSEKHGIVFRMKMFKRMPGADDHEGNIDFTADQLKTEATAISTTTKDFISKIRLVWNEQDMKNFEVEF